jgi:N-acetylglucosamine kinase-like BadF-type ATPase
MSRLSATKGTPELRSIRRTPPASTSEEQKQAALRYILDAWEEALHDGIQPEMLANAALFAALADLIGMYGEDAVAKMANGLSRRIQLGEFTLKRTPQ